MILPRLMDFENYLSTRINQRKAVDTKGKGKAVDGPDSLEMLNDTSDQEHDENMAKVMTGVKKLRFSTRFDVLNRIKIFSKEIRTGRL